MSHTRTLVTHLSESNSTHFVCHVQTHAMMVFCKPYPTQPKIMSVMIQLFTKREWVKCVRNGWLWQFLVHYHILAANSKYGNVSGTKDLVILWWPQCAYLNSSVVCWAILELSWKPSFKYQLSAHLPVIVTSRIRDPASMMPESILEQLWYILVFCHQLSIKPPSLFRMVQILDMSFDRSSSHQVCTWCNIHKKPIPLFLPSWSWSCFFPFLQITNTVSYVID